MPTRRSPLISNVPSLKGSVGVAAAFCAPSGAELASAISTTKDKVSRMRVNPPSLLSDHVRQVPLVLAHVFQQLRIRHQFEGNLYAPRFGVRLGIVERELDVHAAKIDAPDSLRDLHIVGVWIAAVIEPGAIGNAHGFDDKGVLFPASHRIAKPGRMTFRGQRTSVGVDLPVADEYFVQHQSQRWCLDDFKRVRWERHAIRHALGKTLT